MKKKFKKLIPVLTVVLTVTAVFTMKTHAISLDYSGGSSFNNTGASATTSGFSIAYDNAKDNICGYRFSIVSSSGTPKSGTRVVNIYLSNIVIGSTAYSSGQRFSVSSGVVANKKQLSNGTKANSNASAQGCDYKSGSCGFYSSLPQNPDSIGTWIKNSSNNYQNLSRIYVICGTNLSNASESDYVLTEPIFRMKLAGVPTSATATELAIYGANVSGGDGYNGGNGRLYNAGSGTLWNLMNYINREFPNALYVSSDTAVYKAVSAKSSGRYAYKDIVKNGYGCSVLTVKNIITIKKDYTDTINHWAWGFNGNGNNGNRDAFKIAVTTFTKKNGDVFTLTEANAAAIPNGFYLNNTYQIGTSSVDGTWRNYPYGTKFTQKNNSMGFEYDYHPYNYNITYDLDGGVNNPNNPTGYNVLYGKNLYAAAKAGYEFLGWMRDFTNSQITLRALNHKFNYYNVLKDVEPETEYEITIGNARTTAGSASQFSCIIYDFTDSKCLAQKNIPFGSNISFSVICPASADAAHDIRLLFYSGVSGSTSGIASVYSNVNIKYYLDGINKGCNSAFGSPSELYTELSKRTTGDIKLIAKWKQYKKITIVPIAPNAPYREKTNVISSFWLVNLSDDDYTPTTGAKVVFGVYNSSGEKIVDETQDFVVPKRDKNLAYFGWHIPDGYAAADVTVKAYIDEGSHQYSHTAESFTIASYDTCIEPDTDYNAKAPDGFTVPSASSDSTASGRWWQWVYSGGSYSKKQFAVANAVNNLILTAPTNPSAYTRNGKLYMKSGYGFEVNFNNSMYTVSGYTDDSVNKCFAPQYYYALFPEYNYTYGRDKSRSIESVSGKKVFVNAADMARQHFTPIYYPDGEYKFKVVLSDCWTPAGMITTYKTVILQIDGNAYDDWYVGRK